MSSDELLAAARVLVRRSHDVEADLLVHLAEIDERQLYLERAFPSMFAFCVGELGFSEDAAYNRIMVARAGRRYPAIIDALRAGSVHLWGMRLLIPHLTEANHRELIARATGKSKRDIEEQVAVLAPREPIASTIRSVPPRLVTNGSAAVAVYPPDPGSPWTSNGFHPTAPGISDSDTPVEVEVAHPSHAATTARGDSSLVELQPRSYLVKFTVGRPFRDKLSEAQDLMRHRVPDGNLATIFGAALDVLIEQVKKEKFAVGKNAKPRNSAVPAPANTTNSAAPPVAPVAVAPVAVATDVTATTQAATSVSPQPSIVSATHPAPAATEQVGQAGKTASRHIPNAIKRAVYERDGGRCAFVDERGQRCPATGALEFDHEGGFNGHHEVEKIRLLCRQHNQREAEKMYGRSFMQSARKRRHSPATRSGTSRPPKGKGR